MSEFRDARQAPTASRRRGHVAAALLAALGLMTGCSGFGDRPRYPLGSVVRSDSNVRHEMRGVEFQLFQLNEVLYFAAIVIAAAIAVAGIAIAIGLAYRTEQSKQ